MSTLVFPTLPGMDTAIKRTPVYATKVQTASSGKELRASFQSTPRFRYALPLNFLRQAILNATADEASQLLTFFDTMRGRWDSFWLPDYMAVNLISNPSSEDANPTGYGASGVTASAAYAGTKSRGITSPSGSLTYLLLATGPATPGEQIYFQAQVLPSPGAFAGMIVDFLDAGGGYISGGTSPDYSGVFWQSGSAIGTAPTNTASYRLMASVRGSAGAVAYFDNLTAIRMGAAGIIAAPDGTLTRIATDTLDFQRKVRFNTDELDFERFLAQVWEAKSLPFISVK